MRNPTDARPRVLHVGKFYPPDYLGGIETYSQNLCMALRDQVEFRVAVSGLGHRTTTEILDGIPVTRLATAVQLGSAPFSPGLVKLLREATTDVLHFHLPNPTAVLAWFL